MLAIAHGLHQREHRTRVEAAHGLCVLCCLNKRYFHTAPGRNGRRDACELCDMPPETSYCTIACTAVPADDRVGCLHTHSCGRHFSAPRRAGSNKKWISGLLLLMMSRCRRHRRCRRCSARGALTLWLMMVPYPLRFARMLSLGLFAAYTYTFGILSSNERTQGRDKGQPARRTEEEF